MFSLQLAMFSPSTGGSVVYSKVTCLQLKILLFKLVVLILRKTVVELLGLFIVNSTYSSSVLAQRASVPSVSASPAAVKEEACGH